jgi:hypothetical protein
MMDTVSHSTLVRISQAVRMEPVRSIILTGPPNSTLTVYTGPNRPIREVTTDANGKARFAVEAFQS